MLELSKYFSFVQFLKESKILYTLLKLQTKAKIIHCVDVSERIQNTFLYILAGKSVLATLLLTSPTLYF